MDRDPFSIKHRTQVCAALRGLPSGGIDQAEHRQEGIEVGLAPENHFLPPPSGSKGQGHQVQGGGHGNRHDMTGNRQVLVAVVGVLLVVGVGSVVKCNEIKEGERNVRLPMLGVVLYQFAPAGRLVKAEARQQTATQHQTRQHDGQNRFHLLFDLNQ